MLQDKMNQINNHDVNPAASKGFNAAAVNGYNILFSP